MDPAAESIGYGEKFYIVVFVFFVLCRVMYNVFDGGLLVLDGECI